MIPRQLLLVVGTACVAALWGSAAEAEIRIAVAGPMTGAYAWFGEQYQRGAGLAVAISTPRAACSARASS
jgi:branched-chain amino acid transport system substrate-binding protein